MKNLWITLLLLMFLETSAQEYQCNPNTCTVKNAGKYKVELASCNTYIEIYVLTENSKPLRGIRITGVVDFLYIDETYLTAELTQYYQTNFLTAKIPAPGFYNFRVTLNIKGELVTAYFDNECDLRAEKKHGKLK